MKNTEMPELTADSEEGFVDLCLKMEGLVCDRDGMYRFEARVLHQGRPVAFAVVLGATWKPQELEGTTELLYWGEVRLSSLGSESDAFVRALDQLYETKVSVSRKRGDIEFTAVSLEGHPLRLAAEPLKMKLFFEADTDELYAEFYLNCDSHKNGVQFHEKDPEYRRAVVLALAQNAG